MQTEAKEAAGQAAIVKLGTMQQNMQLAAHMMHTVLQPGIDAAQATHAKKQVLLHPLCLLKPSICMHHPHLLAQILASVNQSTHNFCSPWANRVPTDCQF